MSTESRASAAKSRSVRTCTECKQAKLRCDSKENFPNPCTRCRSRQLFCTIDAAFQRTPARKRLEAMSKEIQELRTMREGDAASTSQTETDTAPTEQMPELLPENNLDLGEEVISLDDIVVETSLVVDAFENFVELFHPQLPLLESIVLRRIYRAQPFLFWTLLVIVASHLPDPPHVELYSRLQGAYKKLLKEEAMSAPLPLHKIQALLFLCAWPLPIDSQVKDPSWLYCGIAIHAARYMGLDREQPLPTSRSVGVLPGAERARVNTWLGCFYVSTSLSLHLGLQPPIISDPDFATISNFLNKKTVPFQIATYVRIHLVVAKFTNVLLQSSTDIMSNSLIRLVNNEFEPLKSTFESDRPGSRKIEFTILVAKLHFYALVITKLQKPSSAREVLLQTGLAAALRLIHIAAIPRNGSSESDGDRVSVKRQRSMPKNYYRGLAFATIFLITFFHLNKDASQEERQSAVTHISLSQDVFRACTMDPLDEYARAARMFELLARLPPGSADPAKLRLTHRMGVSIMVNASRMADEVRGRPTEIVENQNPEEETAAGQSQTQDQASQFDSLSAFDYNSDFGFFKEFWDDPIMNMLDFDAVYPTHELPL